MSGSQFLGKRKTNATCLFLLLTSLYVLSGEALATTCNGGTTTITTNTNSVFYILNSESCTIISSSGSVIRVNPYPNETGLYIENNGQIGVSINYDYAGVSGIAASSSSIDSVINNGIINPTIFGINSASWGVDVGYNRTINSLTNTGYISPSATGNGAWSLGIRNLGVITTLNNAQGGDGTSPATTALTLGYYLPVNYNIIISSQSYYGQLVASNTSGSTNFDIYAGSIITSKLYPAVLQGLTSANVGSTRSGTYDGLNWTLSLQTGSSTVWDLIFSGTTLADAQSSLQVLAKKLRSGFSSQAVATNFANMNTYDCDLFDAKGICVSVGGQQTYVDNPSSNLTSTVVVAGYKVSPQIRIGGFLNQNINNNTVSSVHMSNANPLMGLFAVWNQNEDRLGYQVKIANAYQDKDVTTTRDIIGTSEAGTGKTSLNTQSYVSELSYAFLANEDKTLVRPYAAVRYTRIKQDGYTEQTTNAVTAPLTYALLEDRSTAALIGVKLDHKLADNFHLKGSLGIEQDIYHHVDNLTATGVSGLTSENFNDNIKRTRPVASIGAYFSPAKNQLIAADVYYQQLPFQSTASTTAYVNYMIGF